MLILDATTKKFQVVLSGAVTTNQLPCVTSWRDITTTAYTPGPTDTTTNNTTAVDVVPAPAASTQRVVDYFSIFNEDTVDATVTFRLNNNGTTRTIIKVTLATGERLEYAEGQGFRVFDNYGRVKIIQTTAPNITTQANVVVLGGDVINNNAVANTIADVTGLSFAVTAGQTYWFEFIIPYTSAATTTGSRWAINGPASPTMLAYRSEYTLTATSLTNNSASAYDTPSAASASSLTAGNIATIWGIITPSSDGTVIARFASEVLSSAITAKAGATCRWMRVL